MRYLTAVLVFGLVASTVLALPQAPRPPQAPALPAPGGHPSANCRSPKANDSGTLYANGSSRVGPARSGRETYYVFWNPGRLRWELTQYEPGCSCALFHDEARAQAYCDRQNAREDERERRRKEKARREYRDSGWRSAAPSYSVPFYSSVPACSAMPSWGGWGGGMAMGGMAPMMGGGGFGGGGGNCGGGG